MDLDLIAKVTSEHNKARIGSHLNEYINALNKCDFRAIDMSHGKIMDELSKNKVRQIIEVGFPNQMTEALRIVAKRGKEVNFDDLAVAMNTVKDIMRIEYELRVAHDYVFKVAKEYQAFQKGGDIFSISVAVEVEDNVFLNLMFHLTTKTCWIKPLKECDINGGIIKLCDI